MTILLNLYKIFGNCSRSEGLAVFGKAINSRPFLPRCFSCSVGTRPIKTDDNRLLRELCAKIRFSGPITVHDYMREVLTNPVAGYYTNLDVFGAKGDYVTSPEISQLFGEMIAIWILNEWLKMGTPKPLILSEFGPGRGTLMFDILKVFAKFLKSLEGIEVHLIERSPAMSRLQEQTLCSRTDQKDPNQDNPMSTNTATYKQSTTADDIPIFWHTHLDGVPQKFTFFIANEFFDALPIHKLRKKEDKWKEILIDIDQEAGSDEDRLRYVLSREETPASKLFSKFATDDDRLEVEVCPEAAIIAMQLSKRIEKNGGACLIIDYGHEGTDGDTFRAFQNHKQVDPLLQPGHSDLTADVDFSYIKRNVEEKLLCYGPVEQGFFLNNMGLETRLNSLLKVADTAAQAKMIARQCQMLTNPKEMGSRFKFFSMFPKTMEKIHKLHPVAGFHLPPDDKKS